MYKYDRHELIGVDSPVTFDFSNLASNGDEVIFQNYRIFKTFTLPYC